MKKEILNSTNGSKRHPFAKSASSARDGSNFSRNMTNATHALNESNEEKTSDDSSDSEDDSSPDIQSDPTKDDWIDRTDYWET